MASVLSANTPNGFLSTFLDCDPTSAPNTGPFLYLPGPSPGVGTLAGGAFPNPSPTVPVQITIHPHNPATSVFNGSIVLNGGPAIAFNQSTQFGALILSFNLPIGSGEVAGRWNSLSVTAQDNSSGNPLLTFSTFYYYLNPLAVPPTTPAPPTTTLPPPPPTMQPTRRPRPKSKKKGKR